MKSSTELKKIYKGLKAENIKLMQTVEIMGQKITTQGQAIEELRWSVAGLKRRLR